MLIEAAENIAKMKSNPRNFFILKNCKNANYLSPKAEYATTLNLIEVVAVVECLSGTL